MGGDPGRTSSSTAVDQPLSQSEAQDLLEASLVHLDETLDALAIREPWVARARYEQFLASWDEVTSVVEMHAAALRPAIGAAMDQIEDTLLGRVGDEDFDGSTAALWTLRTILQAVADELAARPTIGAICI